MHIETSHMNHLSWLLEGEHIKQKKKKSRSVSSKRSTDYGILMEERKKEIVFSSPLMAREK